MNPPFSPSQKQIRDVFLWFANQDFTTQKNIFRQKQLLFRHSKEERGQDLALLDFQCFCQAIADAGWKDEQDYSKGKAIAEDAARQMAVRRRRRANNSQAHRVRVRLWLNKNWGKVLEFRRADLGWRRVSQLIKAEHGITISHTTLLRYDTRFSRQV